MTKFKPGDLCRCVEPANVKPPGTPIVFKQNSALVLEYATVGDVMLFCGYEDCKDPEVIDLLTSKKDDYSLVLTTNGIFGVMPTNRLSKIINEQKERTEINEKKKKK